MIPAGDVIEEARDVMREFDIGFLPDNSELWRRLNRTEREILPTLVQVAESGIPFPGDSEDNVDVSTWARSYPLPTDAWRTRQLELNYSDGTLIPIQRVNESWDQNIPPVEPALFLRGGSFFPIDGVTDGMAASRSFGWSGADSVDVLSIPEPTAITDDSDNIASPDAAANFLGYSLASWMATRAKAAQATVQQINTKASGAWESLLGNLSMYPGPPNAPTG